MGDEVDGELLAQMRRDDVAGLSGLYDRHAGRVMGLARRILGNRGDPQDIVQEVFVQAWTQRDRYDETRGAVLTWLLMITRSRAIDCVRAEARARVNGEAMADVAPDPATAPGDVLLSTWARGALASLPAGQRLAIELGYFGGYTHSEIATLLRQPLGTIKTRIRLAMIKLRSGPAAQEPPSHPRETPFTVSLSELFTAPVVARTLDSLHGVRVLVVDDNPDTLDMVATVLECAGASVMRGRSTTEALARLADDWPDVMLADLAMPGEDGFVLVRKARALERVERRLRAGAFTGLTGDGHRRAALTAGYDLYLAKPIQPHAIVRAVAGLAANRA